MVCYPCQDCVSCITREEIVIKLDVLKSNLLGDELRKKVYVAGSFFSCIRMLEPRLVETKIEAVYGVDAGAEKAFENEFTDVLFSVTSLAECMHV